MRKIAYLLVLLGIAGGHTVRAQECMGMKITPGSGYEMLMYTAKDKPNGKLIYKFKGVRQEAGSTIVDVVMQAFDEKGKAGQELPLHYVCTGNELIADLSGANQMTNGAMKDTEMRVKSNQLTYPRELAAGEKLKDGEMQAEVYNNGAKMMDIEMKAVNRQVEGKESITTPAGTFTTYKVTQEMNMLTRTIGIPIRSSFRTVSYRSNDTLFDVKSETYNKNGKLMSYSVLSKVF